MPPIPVHPALWGTSTLAIWSMMNMPVLQNRAIRFWVDLWPTGPEVVLDIFLFRPNWGILPPRVRSLSVRNLVMIAAAEPEIWG